MVRLEGETSNALFETLEQWEAYLKSENIQLSQPVRPPAGPKRRGPSL